MRFAAAILAALLLSACAADPHPNDCAVVARAAQAELPAAVWSRLLWTSYPGGGGHTYLVFAAADGRLLCYDSVFGSRILRGVASRSVSDVTRAAAPGALRGWYVEDLPR